MESFWLMSMFMWQIFYTSCVIFWKNIGCFSLCSLKALNMYISAMSPPPPWYFVALSFSDDSPLTLLCHPGKSQTSHAADFRPAKIVLIPRKPFLNYSRNLFPWIDLNVGKMYTFRHQPQQKGSWWVHELRHLWILANRIEIRKTFVILFGMSGIYLKNLCIFRDDDDR